MRRLLLLLATGVVSLPAWAQQAPPAPNPSGAGESLPAEPPSPVRPVTPAAPPTYPTEALPAPPPPPATKAGKGVTLQAEAGVLAYSGSLSHLLGAGPSWGAEALIRSHLPVGVELRYQGATNHLSAPDASGTGTSEARVLQNGAQALVHVPLVREHARAQPYLGAGVGFAWYTLSDQVAGFQDDSLGQVPVSAGVNFHLRPPERGGSLTVGLRGDYEWLFSDQFSPTEQGGDQYRGELTMGGSF